jgi:hypothetical protein
MENKKETIVKTFNSIMPVVDRATSYAMIHAGVLFRQNKLLQILARHRDIQVRIFLSNKRTSEEQKHLYLLAIDSQEKVRTQLARSKKKLPGEILAILATDSSEKIRYLIAARREELPIPIYYALLNENNTRVLSALSINPKAPQWVIDKLLETTDKVVPTALKMNTNISQETQTILYLRES